MDKRSKAKDADRIQAIVNESPWSSEMKDLKQAVIYGQARILEIYQILAGQSNPTECHQAKNKRALHSISMKQKKLGRLGKKLALEVSEIKNKISEIELRNQKLLQESFANTKDFLSKKFIELTNELKSEMAINVKKELEVSDKKLMDEISQTERKLRDELDKRDKKLMNKIDKDGIKLRAEVKQKMKKLKNKVIQTESKITMRVNLMQRVNFGINAKLLALERSLFPKKLPKKRNSI